MIEVRDASVPIVIFQLVPFQLHHGGLAIARTAGRLGIRVYWVHGHSLSGATMSRYVYRRIFCDTDAPNEAIAERILEQGRQIGREPILIPVDDRATAFAADHAGALSELFLFPDQPAELSRMLSNKKELYFLCKRMGVPTPEAKFPQSTVDAARLAQAVAFPVVLKRCASWLPAPSQNAQSVTIVNSPKELLEEYEKLETPGEPNVMLQEYIPGDPESVWMFNGYFTNYSECLASFTGKKMRQGPPFTGSTTLGICLENKPVEEMTISLLRKIGYSGIIDMGYRYDRRDGQYKLLDINPRVGSTFRLFLDSNGMDVVRALYLDLTGQPVPRGLPREGRKWIVEQSDLWSSLQYALSGKLTPFEWARSLRGIEEGAWFAWDDPVPFAAMLGTSCVKAAHKLADKIRATRIIRKLGPKAETVPPPYRQYQEQVDSYFDSRSSDWADIYSARSVEGVIHQQRMAVALKWIDNLALPRGSRILEVGCGAGLTTIELARRGYVVDAIDSSEVMVERSVRGVTESEVGDRVRVFRGNVNSLALEDNVYALVLAMGVIPWLETPDVAVREMARVVNPGGYVITNSDNLIRLNYLIDPRRNPALAPLRRFLKRTLETAKLRKPCTDPDLIHMHTTSYFDRVFSQNRLEIEKAFTLGFGPFSFLGRTLLPDSLGIKLHHLLQALADRGVAGLRSTGSQYVVLARKRRTL